MNFFDEGRVHARQAGQGSGVWGRVGACHLVRILKAAQRVLLSILFAVCLPHSLPASLPPLSLSPCLAALLAHCMPWGTSTRAANLLPTLAAHTRLK